MPMVIRFWLGLQGVRLDSKLANRTIFRVAADPVGSNLGSSSMLTRTATLGEE
jgi:hypothetical protein